MMVDYIGIERVQELVHRVGHRPLHRRTGERDRGRLPPLARVRQVAAPRDAFAGRRHRADADQRRAAVFIQVRQWPPEEHGAGLLTVTAFGVLADVATGYPLLLSELTFTTALRTAAMSALAARSMARPVEPHDGADRQRRAERIPGDRLPSHARHPRAAAVRHGSRARPTKLERNLADCCSSPDLRVVRCGSTAEACAAPTSSRRSPPTSATPRS